jgi:hypothetical protein
MSSKSVFKVDCFADIAVLGVRFPVWYIGSRDMVSKVHASNACRISFVDGGGGIQDLIDIKVGSVQRVVDVRVFDALDDDRGELLHSPHSFGKDARQWYPLWLNYSAIV